MMNLILLFLSSFFGSFFGYELASRLRKRRIKEFKRLPPQDLVEIPRPALPDFLEESTRPRRTIWNAEDNAIRRDRQREKNQRTDD